DPELVQLVSKVDLAYSAAEDAETRARQAQAAFKREAGDVADALTRRPDPRGALMNVLKATVPDSNVAEVAEGLAISAKRGGGKAALRELLLNALIRAFLEAQPQRPAEEDED